MCLKRTISYLTVSCISVLGVLVVHPSSVFSQEIQIFPVDRIIDAESVKSGNLTIRLACVDALETVQRGSEQAKALFIDLIGDNRKLRGIILGEKDNKKFILGITEKGTMNERIIEEGWGFIPEHPDVLPNHCQEYFEEFRTIMNRARKKKRGYWGYSYRSMPWNVRNGTAQNLLRSVTVNDFSLDRNTPDQNINEDLNCSDISKRNFPVQPNDPHNFDRDGDGIGCEE